MSKRRDDSRSTHRGFATPGLREKLAERESKKSVPPDAPRASKVPSAAQPAIDVELVVERKTAPYLDRPWVTAEIWTQNRVYALDSAMRCIDVIEQRTGKSDRKHPLIGAKLVGGQAIHGDDMELSHPYPRAGSEAVFEQGNGSKARFSHTSPVSRVVLRLRVVTVSPERLVPAWQDITGSFRALKA